MKKFFMAMLDFENEKLTCIAETEQEARDGVMKEYESDYFGDFHGVQEDFPYYREWAQKNIHVHNVEFGKPFWVDFDTEINTEHLPR